MATFAGGFYSYSPRKAKVKDDDMNAKAKEKVVKAAEDEALDTIEEAELDKENKESKDKFRVTRKTSLTVNPKPSQFTPDPMSVDFIGQKAVLEKVAFCINSSIPVLLEGETGTGKTSLVRYLAAMTNNGFRRVNHSGGTTVEDIVGKILINEKGTFWVDGVLLQAMRSGDWYLADEINAAAAEINFVYHSLLDDDGYIVLAENNGEIVKPHANFRFFAGMNPVTHYAGTKELNKALKSRFAVFRMDFPAPNVEEQILGKLGLPEAIAKEMVKFASALRIQHTKGDIAYPLSTRDLIMWAKMFKYFKRFIPSAEASILNKVGPEDFDTVQTQLGMSFKSLDEGRSKKADEAAEAFSRYSDQ